jgi:hypothetical protein
MLGTSNTSFQKEQLKSLIYKGKLEEAKEYVKEYFAILRDTGEIIFWNPSIKQFERISHRSAKKYYIRKIVNGDFDIQKWFFTEDLDMYMLDIDPKQPLIYEKNKNKYINLFRGYTHTEQKEFESYDSRIKNKIQFIWEYIKTIWCSNNEKSFDYVKLWISHMINGRKMTTALYLKSHKRMENKSVITDFLRLKVLNQQIVHMAYDSITYTSCINGELEGKILIITEKMPKSSYKLRNYIMKETIEIEHKGKKSYECTNNISVIINTSDNYNSVNLEEDDDPIYFVLRLSDDKPFHYDKIHKYTNDDKVGEVFYWYCKEFASKNIDFKE